MEPTGHFPPNLVYLSVLLVLLLFFIGYRLRKASREVPPDDVTRARLRRVYVCFLLMTGVALVGLGVASIPVPPESQQGLGMLAGMLITVTVWIGLPVAAYNSLFLWRERPIQVLWLLVAILIASFAAFDSNGSRFWISIVVLCSLLIPALAVRGLVNLRKAPTGGSK